ncbi:probable leucine-rich repeat receptor-like protein kinase At1g35710 [Miscanthus floridulus]|uniref:probable leucine-rich repeat receptor-like protein kinase At1g35710 n=1 Tax=Miscanthus floridulus TaxID=154761 RepID=UPI003458751D
MAMFHAKVQPTLLLILLLFQPCLLFLHADAAVHVHHGGVHLRSQQAALLQYWKSTLRSSPALESWREGTSPCSSNWTGIVCDTVHRGSRAPLVVTEITLPNAGIDGRIGELNFSALPLLTRIDLRYNNLIPSELGNMGNLRVLEISENNFTGRIPPSLGNLTNSNLLVLAIHQSSLTGTIPEELGKLTNLEYLERSSSLLTGQVPESLGNLTRVQLFHLPENLLWGPIPSSLGNLMNLAEIELGENYFSGGIPSTFANLTNLYGLILSDNQLTGSIPATLANLRSLTELYAFNNFLSGTLPRVSLILLS